jgi:hypothetical protein
MTVEQHTQIVAAMLAAAPHPVSGEQKAAVRELSDTSRVPDDYRNQATGYRAGWNDCVRQYSAQPAAQDVSGLCELIDDVCEWFELSGLHDVKEYKLLKEAHNAMAKGIKP